MAETKKGNKFVKVHSYLRLPPHGTKRIRIPAHDRSTPRTSTGKGS